MNKTLADFHVVLVGCGRMGSALISGAVKAGVLKGERLSCVDVDTDKADALCKSLGAKTELPGAVPRLFVIAVKPNQVRRAMTSFSFTNDDVVLSLAAGLRVQDIEEAIGSGPRVVRCMPNTPALVGAGITGVHFGHAKVDAIEELLHAVGEVVVLKKESEFDGLTAISGSGPAYVFTAIEALADGGVLVGLDRTTAVTLAIHTIIGAGKLAQESDQHTAALKDAVASPGGTTIAGLSALEDAGFRAALISAVKASAERSRELSAES